MSDEQRKDDEIEVEGHGRRGGYDEPADEEENDVELHVHRVTNVRMDSPSNT